jgi:tetratricopeptide (TPR) repeat protein
MSVRVVFLCAGLVGLMTLEGSAASTSFGPGPAKACYEAASARDGSLAALAECDAAVTGQDLNSRDRAATLVNRGVLRLIRREPQAALADFDLALRLRPELGEALVNRGAALVLLGRHAEAIEAITAGLQIGTEEEHEAYFNRALAYERMGETAKAYADFRRAQELKPDWALPGVELARFSVKPR